jgi:N-acetylglucosaminyldiphosphoundecaprenol N-acetyl-beta-D-mannosaminyltransferase
LTEHQDTTYRTSSILPKKANIFGSWISLGTYSQFIDAIFALAEGLRSSYVCFANVHMVIEAYKDPSFASVINKADLVTPDGKPLTVFLKLFRGVAQERVAGMDVIGDLLRECARRGKSVYFFGTTESVLEAMCRKAMSENPTLRISGHYSPPFRPLTDEEKEEIVYRINSANPDLVLVALGCPKQERWMAENRGKINACMLGLGQAFQVYAGMVKRSPKWMQDYSLEWVYRLALEPKRLWKRYLVTNSHFLWLTIQHFFARLFQPSRLSRNPRV